MENFNTGIVVAIQGMLIVFLVLIILMFVLQLMKLFSTKPEVAEKPQAVVAPIAAPEPQIVAVKNTATDDEIIAVISAAVAAMSGIRSTYNLQIKSIRQHGQSTPIWNATSRKENLESRF